MPDYDNTNKGALFTNERKETDKHPDVNGKLNVAGVEHWISGWWKQGKKGEFLSLSLGNPVESQGRAAPVRSAPMRRGRPAQDDLEDAPF